jgi:hypothetical protein
MSKKAKSEAKKRRRQKKSARKIAQRMLYEQRKRDGQNTKSKRVKLRAKRKKTIRLSRHRAGPCGNIGCETCNPIPENLHTPSHSRSR